MEPFSLKDVLIRVHMFIGLLYFISFVFLSLFGDRQSISG